MFLARDKHHLTDLCHLIRHDAPYIFQEYIKESHGRDVRVVLVGGRVIGSMLRCSTDGRMQSNCSLGRQNTLISTVLFFKYLNEACADINTFAGEPHTTHVHTVIMCSRFKKVINQISYFEKQTALEAFGT